MPKKDLYAKLAQLQTQYGDLVLRQEEVIKKLRESYYPVFAEIQQKYLTDFKTLQSKEKVVIKQLNQEIKKLKQQQRQEMHQFKITNRQVRKEIKQELKTIDVKLRNDPGVQKEVMVLKQNLATQLATMKQQFNAENKLLKKNIV